MERKIGEKFTYSHIEYKVVRPNDGPRCEQCAGWGNKNLCCFVGNCYHTSFIVKKTEDAGLTNKQEKSVIAYKKLLKIANELNGDWEPNIYDENQEKWIIRLAIASDGWVDIDVSELHITDKFVYATIGNGIVFRSESCADYVVENHLSLLSDLFSPLVTI